jgi:hypothetical protein
MRSLDDAAVGRPERQALDDVWAADPALAEELEAISAQLGPAARGRFWRALADECPRHRRPASAVLTALERAAGPG